VYCLSVILHAVLLSALWYDLFMEALEDEYERARGGGEELCMRIVLAYEAQNIRFLRGLMQNKRKPVTNTNIDLTLSDDETVLMVTGSDLPASINSDFIDDPALSRYYSPPLVRIREQGWRSSIDVRAVFFFFVFKCRQICNFFSFKI
jgi:hypothetical protein